jgi:hypothetical protein
MRGKITCPYELAHSSCVLLKRREHPHLAALSGARIAREEGNGRTLGGSSRVANQVFAEMQSRDSACGPRAGNHCCCSQQQ